MTVSLTRILFYSESLKDGSTREWYLTGSRVDCSVRGDALS